MIFCKNSLIDSIIDLHQFFSREVILHGNRKDDRPTSRNFFHNESSNVNIVHSIYIQFYILMVKLETFNLGQA
jgi:hypothetical protein